MDNAEEKKYLDLIKKKMKEHGLTSYNTTVFEVFIGKKGYSKGVANVACTHKGISL